MAATAQRPETAGVRVPPPFIYLAGFLVGVLAERAASTPNLPRVPGLIVAAIAAVVAGLLGFDAMRRFVRSRTAIEPWRPASALVTSGPYRFTRNPMYLGMALLYAGLAAGFGFLWAVALLPVVVAAIDRGVIAREERYLERRFGEDYLAYRREVRRWL